ncbi:ADP-ribosylglycohydrolase family protein [Gloeothece verrucosa]|uniref:ADP-ribosylation/Crystallin J1 n=1 Tax=Gloeothece verrucosa (strain PCC 7822) TaxID=497965 RepID=E0UHB3_GLOV7|nr:ADP-ribosylglycohydrolase family protein [Gloeothece verrucosa]ADN16827.1 conserved hypothetical protein [Gloeothece verrucosa PCC 7822]
MQLSLLNRFQGGLLGAWIGASLNKENNQLSHLDQQLLAWIKLAMSLTKLLIDSGQITQENWLEILAQQKLSEPLFFQVPISSAIIALSTLPLALFFHDSPSQFKEYLYSLKGIGQQSQETLEEVIIWQDALRLILREKLKLSPLIDQLCLRHQITQTPLGQQLEQLQTFLKAKIPLQQAASQLYRSGKHHPHEIALACYCFSYTAQEFSLCVKAAKQLDYQPSLTAALTGILAGVYNGISGIPIAWRLQLENDPIPQEMYQQAIDLWAVWSGVDQPCTLQTLESAAIASPLIIQARPAVKMISQTHL